MSPQMFIQPLDVLLFRDGRPFAAGGDHRAESLFPPYPSTIQGAIRSYQLARKNINLNVPTAIEQAVGTPDDYGSLRLRGPFLARLENGIPVRYFPQPVDAYTVAEHEIKPADKPIKPNSGAVTSCPTPLLMGLNDPAGKGETDLWLSQSALMDYLKGNRVVGVESKDLFIRENRFGIGTDAAKGTTHPGMLYEVVFVRVQKDVGLLVEMSGDGYDQWEPWGVLQLGGESRAAEYEIWTDADPLPVPSGALPKQFKLYFATPAYFENGWRPTNWGKFFQGEVTLEAAALGRYEAMGGVNLAHDRTRPDELHRASQRFVPVGSVYYFSSKNGASWQPGLMQNAVTDFGAEIGFGQIIMEVW